MPPRQTLLRLPVRPVVLESAQVPNRLWLVLTEQQRGRRLPQELPAAGLLAGLPGRQPGPVAGGSCREPRAVLQAQLQGPELPGQLLEQVAGPTLAPGGRAATSEPERSYGTCLAAKLLPGPVELLRQESNSRED